MKKWTDDDYNLLKEGCELLWIFIKDASIYTGGVILYLIFLGSIFLYSIQFIPLNLYPEQMQFLKINKND